MLPHNNLMRKKENKKPKKIKINVINSKYKLKEKFSNNKIIKAKNKKIKLPAFISNKNIKYNSNDLCIQKVYELAIIEKTGIISMKNILSYEENIEFNEIPLLFYDKDGVSTTCSTYLYSLDSESSRFSIIRDSILNQAPKRVSFGNNVRITKTNRSKSGFTNLALRNIFRETIMTKFIVFEDSEDSLENL